MAAGGFGSLAGAYGGGAFNIYMSQQMYQGGAALVPGQIVANANLGSAQVEINAASLNYSNSAAHSERSYQQSIQTIQEIINSGPPTVGPRGSAGFWWSVEGSLKGVPGNYELLVSPDKSTI